MRPEVGSDNPAMSLARLVLPPPLGPVTTTNCPSGMARSISLIIPAPSGRSQAMCSNLSIQIPLLKSSFGLRNFQSPGRVENRDKGDAHVRENRGPHAGHAHGA